MLFVGKGFKHELHSELVVRNLELPHNLFALHRAILKHSHREADLFDYTFRDKIINVVALHVKQLVLDRGASAIDYKNYHN